MQGIKTKDVVARRNPTEYHFFDPPRNPSQAYVYFPYEFRILLAVGAWGAHRKEHWKEYREGTPPMDSAIQTRELRKVDNSAPPAGANRKDPPASANNKGKDSKPQHTSCLCPLISEVSMERLPHGFTALATGSKDQSITRAAPESTSPAAPPTTSPGQRPQVPEDRSALLDRR